MTLHDWLEQVDSKETFLHFIRALKEDKIDEERKEMVSPSSPYAPGANGWENDNIVDFLDAMERFGEDSNAVSSAPVWKNFALLLYAGKYYE